MRVLVACANGAGTSLMMKIKVEKAIKEMNLPLMEIKHCSLAEGKTIAGNYDCVFCSRNFVDMFKSHADNGVKVIGMKNILSVNEAKQHLVDAGYHDGSN